MSNDPRDLTEKVILKDKKTVDRSIRTLMADMEHENTLLAESANSRVQRVLKVYRGIKPLFAVLASLPILPSNWRAAIVMFNQVLESLAAVDVAGEFKAGKDL
ncbi:MAG TPA: hypothetical protein VGQ36_16330 [Thermoanaerobaculia bacterium]|jgi:flagellar motility protein MotE (MotC chaperone)|nr:hypothetical protein [Thermoanaerobaculia bacterium]